MSGERPVTTSLHLPPPDAWKQPDRWLGGNRERFYAPVDDRGFVLPDETVAEVQSLFRDDYEWPIDRANDETRPDVHHFQWPRVLYKPNSHDGNEAPAIFRGIATRKGLVPRQFHNVIHHVTLPPKPPRVEAMADYVISYDLAIKLLKSAKGTLHSQQELAMRKSDSEAYGDTSDTDIGNEFLIEAFDERFQQYKRLLQYIKRQKAVIDLAPKLAEKNHIPPQRAIRILGATTLERRTDYTGHLLVSSA